MKSTYLVILLGFVAVVDAVHGAGAIQLRNSALTKVKLRYGSGEPIDVPAGSPIVYGLFVAVSNECPRLVLPLATPSATPGLIDAPSPYFIPDTSAGDTVNLTVRAWPAADGLNWCAALLKNPQYFGDSAIFVSVTLGEAESPTTIWQSASGTSLNRLKPLTVGMLSPGPVYLTVNDILVAEGNSGQATANFTVRREYGFPPYGCCTNLSLTSEYRTADGTALAGQDFLAASGSFQFAPGESVTTIPVTLTADESPEPEETFTLTVQASPVFSKLTGTARITEARIVRVGLEGGAVVLTVVAANGRHFSVERSMDLKIWTVVNGSSDVAGNGGMMSIRDDGAASDPPRFYRMRLIE